MLLSGIIAALTSLLLPIIILLLLLPNACYVVEQQHAVIIERLGKFNRIVNAGFHMKVPVIDRKAATVSLRTMKNGFGIDVKTQDNVTIGLEVSAQYHVSYDMGAGPADSGIYKSYYMLQEPVDQMRDFITDALRSSIPVYTLDEVFAKKDDIAKDVNATVSEQMAAYGFTLVSTLITKIALPTEVENHERHQRRPAQARCGTGARRGRPYQARHRGDRRGRGYGKGGRGHRQPAQGHRAGHQRFTRDHPGDGRRQRRGQPAVHVYAVVRDDDGVRSHG